ncbi:MAG: zinc ribbon domain-containing protein [Planctomycetota bacterium]
MKPCRDCQTNVSEQALACPKCGAPFPAREKWDGWGFEYKSAITIAGLPLVHISFKYAPGRGPIPARGIIAIGQFAIGIVTISQFGIGVVSVSQFTIAGFALAQFAVAYSLIAQMGLFLGQGRGQLVRNVLDLIRQL